MPIIEGEVQEFGETGGGKPKIKVAGGWYVLGNTVMDGVSFGDRISIEWNEWSPPGNPKVRLRMIQGWGMLSKSAPRQPVQPTPQPAAPPPQQHQTYTPPPPSYSPTPTHTPQPPAPEPSYPDYQQQGGTNAPPRSYEDLPRNVLEGAPLHDADQLRLISNVMAALVTAGVVKHRQEAVRWMFALSCGVRGVQFLESEIPF